MSDTRPDGIGSNVSEPGSTLQPTGTEPSLSRGESLHPVLAAARAGNEQALARLLDLARPVAYTVIRPRLRGGWCEDWTDDVVHDVLLDVVRAHGGCRASSDADLAGWVAAIARREVADFFRREQHQADVVGFAAVAGLRADDRDEPSARMRAALDSLRQAVSTLELEQHQLLYTRLIAAASWAEVGEELGVPPTAAKRRFQRLLVRIKRTCEPPGSGGEGPRERQAQPSASGP